MENTVILPLGEYNRLRILDEALADNKNVRYFYYSNTGYKIINNDEVVLALHNKIQELENKIEKLYQDLAIGYKNANELKPVFKQPKKWYQIW